MTRQFHNMSIEDREMFAYNAAHERKQQQLAKITPEQRIKYAFEFLTMYIADGDEMMKAKCYAGIAKYSDLLETSESHFWIMDDSAFVSPKSKKARNRFCNQMDSKSECIIEQNKGDRVFLRSLNGQNFFWVDLNNDSNWEIEF